MPKNTHLPSRRKILPVLVMLVILPIPGAFAQGQIIEKISETNQTIIIHMPAPEVHININSTATEQLLALLKENQKNDVGYDKGDLLTVSATIISFFSFGLFVSIRIFNQKKSKLIIDSHRNVLYLILFIIILHIILLVVLTSEYFIILFAHIIYSATLIVMLIICIIMANINKTNYSHSESKDFVEKYVNTHKPG